MLVPSICLAVRGECGVAAGGRVPGLPFFVMRGCQYVILLWDASKDCPV